VKQLLRYVIELDDEPVGVVIEEHDTLTFHAVHPQVQHLDGHLFADRLEVVRLAILAVRQNR
jgi:hypothetical protein